MSDADYDRSSGFLFRSGTWHEDAPTLMVPERPAWHAEAACRAMDPALFFPSRGETTHEAKEACASCPVREQCLDAALEARDPGIWGGTSEKERRRMRTRRAA